jgi:two-component system response regulator HydG
MAEGGTLFLDEIGTMPYEIQAMLLRVLQENTYLPVGGKRERKADVRIVAATNEDMAKAIRDDRFREDLYHRLCEFEIRLPLLSECPDDILPLAEFFRERYSKELRRETCGFTEDAAERLLAYAWPGNVRELQNKVKRAVLLAESGIVRVEDMGLEPAEPTSDADHSLAIRDEAGEKRRIVEALKRCGGNRTEAAKLLRIDRATLYRKMRKYGLNE